MPSASSRYRDIGVRIPGHIVRYPGQLSEPPDSGNDLRTAVLASVPALTTMSNQTHHSQQTAIRTLSALFALALTLVGCKANEGAEQAPRAASSGLSTDSSSQATQPTPAPPNPSTEPSSADQTAEKREPADSIGEYHLDPDPLTPAQRPRRANRVGELELTLRSTPPGAIASIDGQPIGPTPAYWSGDKTTGAREFTFALAGYAVARYRFVPTKSGVVHGTLRRLVAPAVDAGSPTAQTKP